VEKALSAALAAADPYLAVRRSLQLAGGSLHAGGREYPLQAYEHIYIVGAGKAGAPMLAALEELLSDHLYSGVVIVKEGHAGESHLRSGRVAVLEGGHPVPDERSLAGTQYILGVLSQAGPHDLVIVLLSGGGSALLACPAPPITLDELQALTTALLKSGANIEELNTVRKHLDLVKGGGLAQAAGGAHVLALILSDVPGDPLEAIASGPTAPDPTTYADALAVLDRYEVHAGVPAAVLQRLEEGNNGLHPETLKPGSPRFDSVKNILIGGIRPALEAALQAGEALGYAPTLLTATMHGEARTVGAELASRARRALEIGPRPALLAAGGETTVTVNGSGLGGRNQELVLGAVRGLAGLDGVSLISFATDGGDGMSPAAGAAANGSTLARAQSLGLDPDRFLSENDSYHFFQQLGDLVITGPTRTNVNDLVLLLISELPFAL
jgi:hydroxypyruvate reductase